MHTSQTLRKSFEWACILALLIFLAKAAFLATAPTRGLGITSWIIDDTFIIMRVARNIALGYGFTYDFVHPTTGAPPLWTYITSVNHLLFPLPWAVKATFIETAFFASLATLVVFLIALKITGRKSAAWIAFLLATFTGNAFFEAMNGMDTSLFTLGVVLSVALYLEIGKPERMPAWIWGAIVGLSIGITSLVRGDGIFLIGSLGLVELIRIIRSESGERTERIKFLISLAVIAGLCFLALIGWQVMRTGSPFLGNQVGRRELALALHGFSFADFHLKTYLKIVGWNVFQLEKLIAIALGSSLLGLLALAVGCLKSERRRFSIITLVYCSTFFAALVAYQWYFPDLHGLRYVNPAIHLLTVLVAALLVDIPEGFFRRSWIFVLTASIIILSDYGFYDFVTHLHSVTGTTFTARPSPAVEQSLWATIDWVNANLPKGAVIGVRDHGRFALFTDRPVQDLAGNIDPTVPLLIRKGGIKEYLKMRNVAYVLIPTLEVRKDMVYQVLHRDLKLEPVVGAPVFRGTTLYKIIW